MTGTTVVLGGGVGGIVASSELRERVPNDHRVVMVERNPDHVFPPSLLWVASGTRSQNQITKPLKKLVRRGVERLQGEIERIDADRRRVHVDGQALDADHLVISLGADLAPERIPGLEGGGHNLYTIEGAKAARNAVAEIESGRLVILTAAPAYKCPAAPYEAAMLLAGNLRRRGVGDEVKVDMFAAEPGPMGVTGPDNSAAVRGMVEEKGVRLHSEHQVAEVEGERRRIRFTNGLVVPYDVLVYVPPHQAPRVVRDAGLTDATGWVPVDRHSMATEYPGVFAIGDVTGIPLAVGKPLPMAGTFAHKQAKVVANNIAHAVTGRGKVKRFDGNGACFLETGDGRAGFGSGNFYAEPTPDIRLRNPRRVWHWGKVFFEKWWFRRH